MHDDVLPSINFDQTRLSDKHIFQDSSCAKGNWYTQKAHSSYPLYPLAGWGVLCYPETICIG